MTVDDLNTFIDLNENNSVPYPDTYADLPRTEDPQAGCNGGLALMGGDTGYIESPNYNETYGPNENCKWFFADSGTVSHM